MRVIALIDFHLSNWSNLRKCIEIESALPASLVDVVVVSSIDSDSDMTLSILYPVLPEYAFSNVFSKVDSTADVKYFRYIRLPWQQREVNKHLT